VDVWLYQRNVYLPESKANNSSVLSNGHLIGIFENELTQAKAELVFLQRRANKKT